MNKDAPIFRPIQQIGIIHTRSWAGSTITTSGFEFSVHTGGKNRLSSISKQGDRYLRGLFVIGALAVIRYVKIHGTKHRPWLTALLVHKPAKLAAIALANKKAGSVALA